MDMQRSCWSCPEPSFPINCQVMMLSHISSDNVLQISKGHGQCDMTTHHTFPWLAEANQLMTKSSLIFSNLNNNGENMGTRYVAIACLSSCNQTMELCEFRHTSYGTFAWQAMWMTLKPVAEMSYLQV